MWPLVLSWDSLQVSQKKERQARAMFPVCSSCQTPSLIHTVFFRQLNRSMCPYAVGKNTDPSSTQRIFNTTVHELESEIHCVQIVCIWERPCNTSFFSVQIPISSHYTVLTDIPGLSFLSTGLLPSIGLYNWMQAY